MIKKALVLLGIGFLAACSAGQPPTAELVVPTETAVETSTPTATVEWFPPTSTPVQQITPEPSPTPNTFSGLGEVIFEDPFRDDEGWTLPSSNRGEINIASSELNIVINEAGTYLFGYLEKPDLRDFFVQIKAKPNLCAGRDEYGLLFRLQNGQTFYRYAVSCAGEVRLEKIVGGGIVTLQPWMQSASVPVGAPSVSNLEVLAEQDTLTFFINGDLQFEVQDSEIVSGSFGVFGRSRGENALTVSFSNLIVRELSTP